MPLPSPFCPLPRDRSSLTLSVAPRLVPVPRRFDRRPPERDSTRINERIRVPEVRLIGADGEQVGVVATDDALEQAREPTSTWSRSPPERQAAGLPPARLLEVQVRAGAEGQGRPQAPAAGQRPRDQAAAEDRRPRLRDEEGPRRALPEPEGQGQGDDHVPRPRAGPPRARPGAARAPLRRPRRAWR